MNASRAALYIHIPFCVKKCDYCDFYSSCDLSIQKQLLEKIPRQMSELCEKYGVSTFTTVYLGGGTPGLIKSELMSGLLEYIKQANGGTLPDEVTMECNPGNVSPQKLQEWNQAGINRLSLGVQSFQDEFLRNAGRNSSREKILRALEMIRNFSAFNLNIDLIQGLPGMTREDQIRDLEEALTWEPDHISWYSLILEEGSVLESEWEERNGGVQPDNDRIWEEGCALLEQAGYNRYEISNFCRTGKESRHNTSYWKLRPYLGCGPSAVSMLKNETGAVERFRTVPESLDYSRGIFRYDERENLSPQDLLKDFILMGLRLKKGIQLSDFISISGYPVENLFPESLAKWIEAGCLILNDRFIAPTGRGMNVLNSILVDLFSELDEKGTELSLHWPSE